MDDAGAGGRAMGEGDLLYDKLAHELVEESIKHAVIAAYTNKRSESLGLVNDFLRPEPPVFCG